MRALVVTAVFVFAFVASSTVQAQPGMVEPTQPQLQRAPQAPAPPKSATSGVLLAIGTTVGGVALLALASNLNNNCYGSCSGPETLTYAGALAVVVGPSLGHVYAGHTWNTGLGLRLGGMAALGLGVAVTLPCLVHTAEPLGGGGDVLSNGSSLCGVGEAAILVGLGATVIGTITEIATTPSAVSAYNNAHSPSGITVTPIRTVTGVAPGLSFVGRF